VQHYIALLRRFRFQVGKALPCFQVFGAYNAALRHG
jgi:hypothetical protein